MVHTVVKVKEALGGRNKQKGLEVHGGVYAGGQRVRIWFVNLSFQLLEFASCCFLCRIQAKNGGGGQWGNRVRAKGGDPWLGLGRQRRSK